MKTIVLYSYRTLNTCDKKQHNTTGMKTPFDTLSAVYLFYIKIT
eukprot:SAG11_NODE_24641_length_370_cov_0.955720_2_plen_43_part_01